MKYLIIRTRIGPNLTNDFPVLFPELWVHEIVFDALRAYMTIDLKDPVCIAAGFFNPIEFKCYGRATSFKPNIESRGELDETLILTHQYGAAIKER